MSNPKKIKALATSVQRYTWTLAAGWTMIVAVSLAWSVVQQGKETQEVARSQARAIHMKDILYRRWTALHGGVYVPVTEEIQPNPYLADLPERDVTTLSGTHLTLINPAYMTRLVSGLQERDSGVRAHITSLKPLRPGNAADSWETEALRAFESGEKEVSSMMELDGKVYMRLMRPLVTKEACLKCHAAQGYDVGDIRGGISVSVPMQPLLAIARRHTFTMSLGHAMLWIIGLVGISVGSRQIKRRVNERQRAEEQLRVEKDFTCSLIKKLSVGLAAIDEDGQQILVNEALCTLSGFSEEELLGQTPPFSYWAEEGMADIEGVFQKALAGEEGEYELNFRRKTGERFIALVAPRMLITTDGKTQFIAIVQDITERKQAEERLIESERQLRSLAAHLASAREETMIAISQDLHDELGQILTGLKMDAAWLNGKIPNEQQPLKEKAESIVGDLNDTIQVVRRITSQLRPVILDNQGLVPALRYEIREFEKRTGIECSFTIEPPKLTTDKDHSTVFYRILQE